MFVLYIICLYCCFTYIINLYHIYDSLEVEIIRCSNIRSEKIGQIRRYQALLAKQGSQTQYTRIETQATRNRSREDNIHKRNCVHVSSAPIGALAAVTCMRFACVCIRSTPAACCSRLNSGITAQLVDAKLLPNTHRLVNFQLQS